MFLSLLVNLTVPHPQIQLSQKLVDSVNLSYTHLRNKDLSKLDDIIFALSMIGDDRAEEATYIAGKQHKINN
jgi:hypothetical protein